MKLTVGKLSYCFLRREIRDMNRSPLGNGSTDDIGLVHVWIFHSAWRNSPVMGYKPDHVTIKPADNGIVCLTQTCGALRNHIQHRLNIRRRTGNDSQDLARRSLLLERLLKFVE
jgi:hypothetical protein